jgi:hypothetical protein
MGGSAGELNHGIQNRAGSLNQQPGNKCHWHPGDERKRDDTTLSSQSTIALADGSAFPYSSSDRYSSFKGSIIDTMVMVLQTRATYLHGK